VNDRKSDTQKNDRSGPLKRLKRELCGSPEKTAPAEPMSGDCCCC